MTRAKHNPANRQRGQEKLLGIGGEQLFFVTRAKQNTAKLPPTARTRRTQRNPGASVDLQTM